MTATMYPSQTQANYALRRAVAGVLVVIALALLAVAVRTSVGALLDLERLRRAVEKGRGASLPLRLAENG